MKTTLSTQGRIVVPPGARRQLALRPGTKFTCRVSNGSIVLTPKTTPAGRPRLVRDPATGLTITQGPANGPTLSTEDREWLDAPLGPLALAIRHPHPRLARSIDAQIRRLTRYHRRLRHLDAVTYAAGLSALGSASALGQWLCAPARALHGKVPLMVMHTVRGRREVANLLAAIEQGVYL